MSPIIIDKPYLEDVISATCAIVRRLIIGKCRDAKLNPNQITLHVQIESTDYVTAKFYIQHTMMKGNKS